MQCDDERRDLPGRGLFVQKLFHLLIPLTILFSVSDGHSSAFETPYSALELHGFMELRAGQRTQDDAHEKDNSVMEGRLQAEVLAFSDWVDFKYKGDLWVDGVTESAEYDTREAWFFLNPVDFMDIKIGRQVLSWGTGDLVFLNDLFPKDWQSFFIGRNREYLKAPSDAAKISFFTDIGNIDVVYTPQFDSDRYITGEVISYWHATENRLVGQNANMASRKPDGWFEDDEIAARVYRNIHNYELAVYGYHGFWKRPGGQSPSGGAIFPALNVYGASVRGQVGPGIGNLEVAYYQSADDNSGKNPLINNSEMRYLTGYTQDFAKDFNAGLQYYVEHLLDYREYLESVTDGPVRDRYRHVITLQLTKLLWNQNLELNLSAYYSPSDQDAYLRPIIGYKYSDRVTLEAGGNFFCGENPHTFFGQFEENTNIYTAIRYSF